MRNTLKFWISTRFTLLILTSLLLLPIVNSAELETDSNQISPDFSLPDLRGKTHTMPDYNGKVVLVNFWASWCPPCIYEMPELQRLKKRFADRPFEILAINVGEKKYKVRKFSKVIKLELPVLLDTASETFDDWGVKTLPTSFLIDSRGQIRYQVRGNPGWKTEEIRNIIEEMMP